MFNNISFVGGIHGVGKSTICKRVCEELNVNYLSASEVLKWSKLNPDSKNKKVEDINHTQDLLIEGLKGVIDKNQRYLLDGHYCLLNKDNHINKIPFETFKTINPITLGIITSDVAEIRHRLESRDHILYDLDLLSQMQDLEIEYANELANKLGVKLVYGKENEFSTKSAFLF